MIGNRRTGKGAGRGRAKKGTLRRNEWSFIRERKRVSFPPREQNGNPKHWDVWRCSQIGQIRIERATLRPSNPNKSNRQRLNVEHDVGPDSANSLGGPTTVVHRHSRAPAFSIFRRYNLENYRSVTVSTDTPRFGKASSHNGILLATKRVHGQFTPTITKKLENRGILSEEGNNSVDTCREPKLSHTRPAPQDWSASASQQEPPMPQDIGDSDLRIEAPGIQTSSIPVATPLHSSGSSLDLSGKAAFATSASSVHNTLVFSSETPSISEPQLTPHDGAEDEDSDNDFVNSVSRTSHAVAFSTLDKRSTDHAKNEQMPSTATTRSHSWIQRFIGPPGDSTPHTLSCSLAPIIPPWMTLAPRSKQEDRAVQGLRISFKNAGVPSTRSKGGAKVENNLLAQVPDDSLYMILPLWPDETDPASAVHEQRQEMPSVPNQEQNLYLLVYYVPFDKRGEGNPVKKRSVPRPQRRERHQPTRVFDVRHGFKVMGRLVAHSDLIGAGIRLPVWGLSVTGSLEEAELGTPSASLRDVHSGDFVIGESLDSDGTIEFLPEGLEKLGLCVPRTEPPVQLYTHPDVQTTEPADEDVVIQPLTAIGRAAVEIAWLGGMALMTFYGPQSQDPA